MKPYAFVLCLLLAPFGRAEPTSPPEQPKNGPGGSNYAHRQVKCHVYGEGGAQYWLFEPDAPAPKSAPVVVFLHGWGAMEPSGYGAWIRHLVRRGNVVIFPQYQEHLLTPMQNFTPNTVTAVKDALRELERDGHVPVDPAHFALVGHSMGGALAANLAAVAAEEKLPTPGAVMSVQPGDHLLGQPQFYMPRADLANIPKGTLLLVVVGDDDRVVGEETARRIFAAATSVAAADKNYVTLESDAHGAAPLLGNHFAPLAIDLEIAGGTAAKSEGRSRQRRPGFTDALDFFGTWKLFDGLTDAAFFGRNRDYALGDTPRQRFMGKWSDGVPVKELTVTDRVDNSAAAGK